MADLKDLAKTLVGLTVMEANELAKILEEEYGIKPAATAVAVAGPSAGGSDAGAGEEQTEFSVELTASGANKIAVIKAVREVTGLGLKEAKDIVDAAPKLVKEKIQKEEAESLKAKLEEAGASVTLK